MEKWGGKSMMTRSAVLTQYRRVPDKRTDILPRHSPRLRRALRSKYGRSRVTHQLALRITEGRLLSYPVWSVHTRCRPFRACCWLCTHTNPDHSPPYQRASELLRLFHTTSCSVCSAWAPCRSWTWQRRLSPLNNYPMQRSSLSSYTYV